MEAQKNRIIYDPIYGLIKLTPVEWDIIHSPFYQRLRWIKQLGFSCYVFPGAEHSRFGHSIGVMFNAQKIGLRCLEALQQGAMVGQHPAVPDLFQQWQDVIQRRQAGPRHINRTFGHARSFSKMFTQRNTIPLTINSNHTMPAQNVRGPIKKRRLPGLRVQ